MENELIKKHENEAIKKTIIKIAEEVAATDFMNFPDFDKEIGLDGLPDALTVLIMASARNYPRLPSDKVYDYIDNLLNS